MDRVDAEHADRVVFVGAHPCGRRLLGRVPRPSPKGVGSYKKTIPCLLFKTSRGWFNRGLSALCSMSDQAANARIATCAMLSASTAKNRRSAARVSLRPKPSVPSVL